jgi:hypothetical protein
MGHYHLGLAYVLEQGAVMADQVDVVPAAKELAGDAKAQIERLIADLGSERESVRRAAKEGLRARLSEAVVLLKQQRTSEKPVVREAVRELLSEWWRDRAIAEYFEAYELSIKEALAIEEQPMRGLRELTGYEAAQGFVRLMKARGPRSGEERGRLARVETDLKALEKKPGNMTITPIIFPIDGARSLETLLSGRTTRFDLDGTGRGWRWPWVRRDTGVLVWDPLGKGNIASGRQLFGSVTWWMFFEDGYHALDALDDNRNGELAGEELRGIAVWFDRNENGTSDAGEVVGLGSLGIAAVAARGTTEEGGGPANRAGLRLNDGRVLPTYDWTTAPARGE